MRMLAALIVAAVLSIAPAHARPPELGAALPDAARVGGATYHALGIAVFDAELWSQTGAFSWERPFALSLTYQRSISRRALVERTLREMSSRGDADETLRGVLERCFADVRAGDRITGVSTGAANARFYLNGAQRCEVSRAGFRRAFFGIWLDQQAPRGLAPRSAASVRD